MYDPSDVNKLDGSDKDGIVCESPPGLGDSIMTSLDSAFEEMRRFILALGTDVRIRQRAGKSLAFERGRNFACITKRARWIQFDVLKSDLTFEDAIRVYPGEQLPLGVRERLRDAYVFGATPRR